METKTYAIVILILVVGGFLILKQKDAINNIFSNVKKKEDPEIKECTCNKNKKNEDIK
tara:strand:- start:1258 stop:1431 length:174 start_codon:yes stop_codon:yes gene_type:complete